MKEIVLYATAIVGTLGFCRALLGMYATHWYATRVQKVKSLPQWDCSEFHNIMYQPRPSLVRINDWLEVHHV